MPTLPQFTIMQTIELIRARDPSFTHVDLRQKQLTTRDLIELLVLIKDNSAIKSLNLDGNRIDLVVAQLIRENNKLFCVSLCHCYLDDNCAQALAMSQTLEMLALSNNKIGNVGAQALAENTVLKTLDLRHNVFDHVGAQALSINASLTLLNLGGNGIGDIGAQALSTNTTLDRLYVYKCHIGILGVHGFAENNTLTFLDLGCNNIGDEGAHCIAANTKLRTLNVKANNISTLGAQAFVENNTLTSLDISYNNIGDAGFKALMNNIKLRVLDVSGNQVTDVAARLMRKNTTLLSLAFKDNQITIDAELYIHIALRETKRAKNTAMYIRKHIENNPGKKHLGLCRNSLSYKCIIELCHILEENSRITSLDVRHNHIDVNGAVALAKNTTLCFLDIRYNEIHDEGARAFANNITLRSMDARNNYIREDGMLYLPKNTMLIWLKLVSETYMEMSEEYNYSRGRNVGPNFCHSEVNLLIKTAIKRNRELRNLTLNLRVFSSIIMSSNRPSLPLDLVSEIGSFLLPKDHVMPVTMHANQRLLSLQSLFRPDITIAERSVATADVAMAPK